MDKVTEAAKTLAFSFRNNEDLKDLSKKLFVFYTNDPCVFKAKRLGWYGYTEFSGQVYAAAIDISLEGIHEEFPSYKYDDYMKYIGPLFNNPFKKYCEELNIEPIFMGVIYEQKRLN